MRLHAVFVPPIDVLQDCLDTAQRISLVPTPPIEKQRSGMVARLLRRETTEAPAPALTVVPSEEGFVRLARFGNVTSADAQSLILALVEAARTWTAPTVHVVGFVIDTTVPRPVITAQLGGDTEGLLRIFTNLHEIARQQRFFLDRRSFRAEFPVADVNLPDDPSLRERILFDAKDHRGPDWQAARISMLRVAFDSSQPLEEVALVPVGGAG